MKKQRKEPKRTTRLNPKQRAEFNSIVELFYADLPKVTGGNIHESGMASS